MQTDQPLLTIAIPTYNRSNYLKQLVRSLAPQLRDEPRIELIISDNCSPDDTQSVIESFIQAGLKCRYIRNDVNIGPDPNFLQCFEQARGKYFWLIGDDDRVVPDGVKTVRALLAEADYDLVYTSPLGFTNKDQVVDIPKTTKEPVVYTSAAQYARRVSVMFAFISANIVNKDSLLSHDHSAFQQGIGTNLIQLEWTFAALNNLKSALYIPKVIVLSLSENSRGWGLCRVLGVNLSKAARRIILSQRVSTILENSSLRDFLPQYLLKMKEPGYPLDEESAHDVLSAHFNDNFNYWLFDYPIIMMPTSLARVWFRCSRLLARSARLVGSMLPR